MYSKLFTDSELKEIEDAVEKIESSYPVELVPVFSTSSDDYPTAKYRATLVAFISGFVLLLGLNFLLSFALLPFYIQGMIWVIWVLLFVSLEEFIPSFKKLFLGKDLMHYKSYESAKMEFYKNDVYSNPNRLGILLYLSFFERKFHILSDKRAEDLISEEEWSNLASKFGKDLKINLPAKAIVLCMENLGSLLDSKSLKSKNLAPSILPNNLKINE